MDAAVTREQEVFEAARELADLSAQRAYLQAACSGDEDLRQRVERLLRSDRNADLLFASGEVAIRQSILDLSGAERPGDCIGGYRLLEKIGEGGCGVVYRAEQAEPVRRQVALKILKLGLDVGSVVARFEAERRALALMDHPGIAQIHDAGATASGRPFFVMELVRGVKVTEYCDEQRLTTRERLGLFQAICDAVQHAHQKGIIHRDLKPSNILVTLTDGKPLPKVIDFGIAKAVQGRLSDQTVFTAFDQLLGTPAYMSPEQALMTSADVDTRTDVYSLGVLLYELLTGKTPFDTLALLAAGIDRLRRTIAEVEPVRPSSRLRSMTKEGLTSTARRQQAEPPRLLKRVSGDLDWIVMKCLEKDPARRYQTANGLRTDIGRHLVNEPVLARPPSAPYKARKFVRRHRTLVVAGATVLAVLCLGLLGTGIGLVRAQAEATRARDAEGAARRERDRAHAARLQADVARRAERQLNFQLAFDRGIDLCEQGKVGSGMLWLARALELAPPGEQAMERVIRANLAAWTRELHILKGLYPHRKGVVAGAFSPDGTRVLTGALDGTAQLWDRRTGQAIGAPLWHEAEVHTAIFSADGGRILTTSVDKTARLWDTATQQLLRVFQHHGAVWGGVFTADGKVITSDSHGEIQVWDPDLETPITAWRETAHGIHDLALSADGTRVLGACDDGRVLLWDLGTKRLIASFAGGAVRMPTAIFAGPDRVVSGDIDGSVSLWTWREGEGTVQGEKVRELWRHRGGVHRVRLSPVGTQLLTASYDRTAQVLDLQSGAIVAVPFEHPGATKNVAFAGDGGILTCCEDDGAREWQMAPGSRKALLPRDPGTEQAIFTPDAKYLLTRGAGGAVVIRRAVNGEEVGVPFTINGGIHAFAVSLDEKQAMIGLSDGQVRFFEMSAGQAFGDGFQHRGGAWAVAMSKAADRAVSGGLDGVVVLWDARSGCPIRTVLELRDAPIRGVTLSPDVRQIAVASSDKLTWIVSADTPGEPRKLKGHHGSVMTVAFSRDGRRVVTGSFDNTVMVWDAESGRALTRPMRHSGPFWYGVSFSGDGQTVVAGCDDRTVRLWDVATSRSIGPRLPHDAALRTAAFAENDTSIVSGTSAGTTFIWEVPTAPLSAGVERIKAWLQVSTGLQLGANGEIHALSPEQWNQQRQSLYKNPRRQPEAASTSRGSAGS